MSKKSDIDLAWLAGLVDGEGCIRIQRNKDCWVLMLVVTMCEEATVKRLADLTGLGHVTSRAAYGQSAKGQRHNHTWRWGTSTRQAAQVLRLIRPYLFTKAHEADLALEFASLPVMSGRKSLDPELVAERERLRLALRDAKPSSRFR